MKTQQFWIMVLKKCKYLFLIFLFLISCNKNKKSIPDECNTIEISDELVGKWKLTSWIMYYFSNIYCENLGYSPYSADINNINIVLEIKKDGVIRCFKNDTLIRTLFLTHLEEYPSSKEYDIECGEMYIRFQTYQVEFNQIQIGDSLKIWNPVFDINYTSGTVRAITGSGTYVKIE